MNGQTRDALSWVPPVLFCRRPTMTDPNCSERVTGEVTSCAQRQRQFAALAPVARCSQRDAPAPLRSTLADAGVPHPRGVGRERRTVTHASNIGDAQPRLRSRAPHPFPARNRSIAARHAHPVSSIVSSVRTTASSPFCSCFTCLRGRVFTRRERSIAVAVLDPARRAVTRRRPCASAEANLASRNTSSGRHAAIPAGASRPVAPAARRSRPGR